MLFNICFAYKFQHSISIASSSRSEKNRGAGRQSEQDEEFISGKLSKQILSQARKQLADLEEQVLDENEEEEEDCESRGAISLKEAKALNKSSSKKKKPSFKLKEDVSDEEQVNTEKYFSFLRIQPFSVFPEFLPLYKLFLGALNCRNHHCFDLLQIEMQKDAPRDYKSAHT